MPEEKNNRQLSQYPVQPGEIAYFIYRHTGFHAQSQSLRLIEATVDHYVVGAKRCKVYFSIPEDLDAEKGLLHHTRTMPLSTDDFGWLWFDSFEEAKARLESVGAGGENLYSKNSCVKIERKLKQNWVAFDWPVNLYIDVELDHNPLKLSIENLPENLEQLMLDKVENMRNSNARWNCKRGADVLLARYRDEKRLRDISAEFGISRSLVREIISRALCHLVWNR